MNVDKSPTKGWMEGKKYFGSYHKNTSKVLKGNGM